MTIVVTNPKCQIKQESRINNWRPLNGFLHIKNKKEDDVNEYDKNNGKIVSLPKRRDHILFSSRQEAKTKKHNATSSLFLERFVGNFLVLTDNDLS